MAFQTIQVIVLLDLWLGILLLLYIILLSAVIVSIDQSSKWFIKIDDLHHAKHKSNANKICKKVKQICLFKLESIEFVDAVRPLTWSNTIKLLHWFARSRRAQFIQSILRNVKDV